MTPRTVGPYTLVRVLRESRYGSVHLAVGRHGSQVTLTVLSGESAADPDTRRFFASVVHEAPGGLVGADLTAAVPWVAQPYPSGFDDGTLLARLGGPVRPVAGEPGPAPVPVAGAVPIGMEPPGPPPVGLPMTRPRRAPRAAVLAGSAAGLVFLLLLAGAAAGISALHPGRRPAATGRTGRLSAPSGSPTPAPSGSGSPSPQPVQTGQEPPQEGTWPADWPKFASGESVYHMKLGGYDFEFNVPKTYGCLKMQANPVRWRCIDEHDTNRTRPNGNLVERPCQSPCDADLQRQLRADVAGWGFRWTRTDEHTLIAYGQAEGTLGDQRFWLAMVWYGRGRQVAASFSAPVDRAAEIQKTINDIHDGLHA